MNSNRIVSKYDSCSRSVLSEKRPNNKKQLQIQRKNREEYSHNHTSYKKKKKQNKKMKPRMDTAKRFDLQMRAADVKREDVDEPQQYVAGFDHAPQQKIIRVDRRRANKQTIEQQQQQQQRQQRQQRQRQQQRQQQEHTTIRPQSEAQSPRLDGVVRGRLLAAHRLRKIEFNRSL